MQGVGKVSRITNIVDVIPSLYTQILKLTIKLINFITVLDRVSKLSTLA